MRSSEFQVQLTARLSALDEHLDQLEHDVQRLRDVFPVDADEICSRVQVAAVAVAEIRALLASSAAAAKYAWPSWEDRPQLEAQVQELHAHLASLETEVPRRALRALAETLERGSIRHRVQRRARELDELRVQVRDDLLVTAEDVPPPPHLPGPTTSGDWLQWAWRLQEPADVEALDRLRQGFPRLAAFIELVEASFWSADNPTSPLAADPTSTTAQPFILPPGR